MVYLDWKKDFKNSCKIIETPYLYDEYSHYSKIFNFRTINHKDLFFKMRANFKKYLGVMASTNPMLNAVCLGCKDCTVFDINILNTYFMYLSIAGVIALDYQEFLAFFYPLDMNQFYSKFYFDKLKQELPLDVLNYWENIYQTYPKDKMLQLFEFSEFISEEIEGIKVDTIPSNIFLEEKQFYQLKKQIIQIKLHYIIDDFGNIPNILHKEKFDTIYLSVMQNLIYDNVHGYNYFAKLKEYENLLTKDGVIEGGYFYLQHYREDPTWYDFFINQFRENGFELENIPVFPNQDLDLYHLALIKRKN